MIGPAVYMCLRVCISDHEEVTVVEIKGKKIEEIWKGKDRGVFAHYPGSHSFAEEWL